MKTNIVSYFVYGAIFFVGGHDLYNIGAAAHAAYKSEPHITAEREALYTLKVKTDSINNRYDNKLDSVYREFDIALASKNFEKTAKLLDAVESLNKERKGSIEKEIAIHDSIFAVHDGLIDARLKSHRSH